MGGDEGAVILGFAKPIVVQAPEVSVSIRATAIPGAGQVRHRGLVWGVGGVVVQARGGLVFERNRCGATGGVRVPAHVGRAPYGEPGEESAGARRVGVALELFGRVVHLVVEAVEPLVTGSGVGAGVTGGFVIAPLRRPGVGD